MPLIPVLLQTRLVQPRPASRNPKGGLARANGFSRTGSCNIPAQPADDLLPDNRQPKDASHLTGGLQGHGSPFRPSPPTATNETKLDCLAAGSANRARDSR